MITKGGGLFDVEYGNVAYWDVSANNTEAQWVLTSIRQTDDDGQTSLIYSRCLNHTKQRPGREGERNSQRRGHRR